MVSRFKLQALVKQFPELVKLRRFRELDGEDFDVRVIRLDAEWLNHTPTFYSAVGSLVSIDRYTDIYVAVEGKLVNLAVRCKGTSIDHYGGTKTRHYEGETVIEALDRWVGEGGARDEIRYFVEYVRGVHTHEHTSYGATCTILKLEKGVTLQQRIDEAKQKAIDELEAEIAF